MTDDANVRCNRMEEKFKDKSQKCSSCKISDVLHETRVKQLHFSWRAVLQYKVESEVFQYSVC